MLSKFIIIPIHMFKNTHKKSDKQEKGLKNWLLGDYLLSITTSYQQNKLIYTLLQEDDLIGNLSELWHKWIIALMSTLKE